MHLTPGESEPREKWEPSMKDPILEDAKRRQ